MLPEAPFPYPDTIVRDVNARVGSAYFWIHWWQTSTSYTSSTNIKRKHVSMVNINDLIWDG